MKAIYKRELRSYFGSMYGYVYLAFTLCVIGVYVTMNNLLNATSEMAYTFSDMAFISIFLVPVLTMRSFAEERRNKTDMFLLSLPLKPVEIVLGKYLATLSVFGIPVAVTAIYGLILRLFSDGAVLLGSIGSSLVAGVSYLLLGALLIAICMFISSLTDSVVLAAVGGFAAVLVLYFMDYAVLIATYADALLPDAASLLSFIALLVLCALLALISGLLSKSLMVGMIAAAATVIPLSGAYALWSESFTGLFAKVLTHLSAFATFSSMTLGAFSLGGLVFFLSAIFLCVYMTVQSLEKRRWNS
ncbi:MAG: ABC-2 transporter permease [Clostridia bacterium]|nr:ABC-2 transporter permease [Clostridia bacterium]MBO7296896.1 ABC-2 transporter permease [Clostridia bacterium]